MLDFEGIRIPPLFKIILGAKDSISLVESRTLLKYGSVKDSIDEFNLVE